MDNDIVVMSEDNIRKYTAIIKGMIADNDSKIENIKSELASDYISQDDFEDEPINFDDF